MVTYWRLKTKENFELLALKVVAYERWSLTGGSKYSNLTQKFLVFWKTGRLRKGRNRRFHCILDLFAFCKIVVCLSECICSYILVKKQ